MKTNIAQKRADAQAKGPNRRVMRELAKIEAQRNRILGDIHMDLRRVASQRIEVRKLDAAYDAILSGAKSSPPNN
jgi:hypothetical protein